MRDLGGGQHRRQGHVATGECLAETEDVGGDLRRYEQRAGAAEAGGDLVEDQHQPVLVGDLAEHDQAAVVVDPHPARALEPRLDDDPGELVGVGLGDPAYALGPGLDVAARRRRTLGEDLRGEHLGEHRVHPADRVAGAHAPERVAVIAAAHGQQPGPLRSPAAALGLQRHLDRDLDADGPGVGEEDVLEGVRGDLDEPLGEVDRGRVGQAAEHHVRHPSGLLGECGVQLGHPIAVDRRPPRRHRVDDLEALAVVVGEVETYALGAGDEAHRRRVGHRGVGVPEVLAVEGEQIGAPIEIKRWQRHRSPLRGAGSPGRPARRGHRTRCRSRRRSCCHNHR